MIAIDNLTRKVLGSCNRIERINNEFNGASTVKCWYSDTNWYAYEDINMEITIIDGISAPLQVDGEPVVVYTYHLDGTFTGVVPPVNIPNFPTY